MQTATFKLRRPEYPGGYKEVEVPYNGHIEEVSSGLVCTLAQPLLCEEDQWKRRERLQSLRERLYSLPS